MQSDLESEIQFARQIMSVIFYEEVRCGSLIKQRSSADKLSGRTRHLIRHVIRCSTFISSWHLRWHKIAVIAKIHMDLPQ